MYFILFPPHGVSLAGSDYPTVQPALESSSLSSLGRQTAVLLGDLTQGASNWIHSFLDPAGTMGGARSSTRIRAPPSDAPRRLSCTSSPNSEGPSVYPDGFEPLRSDCLAYVQPTGCPIIRNPFVSPLLAPNNLLRGLPPIHIVVREGRGTQGSCWFLIILYCSNTMCS